MLLYPEVAPAETSFTAFALLIGVEVSITAGFSRGIFAMLALMALVTTFMTGPLLSLVKTEHPATQVAEAV